MKVQEPSGPAGPEGWSRFTEIIIMARGMVYREGIGAGSFPCINGTSETLRKGRPLMAKRTAGFEGAVMN